MTFELSKKKKKILSNLKQIENFDIISLSLKIFFNLFYMSISNLNNIKTNAKYIVLLFYYLNKQKLIPLYILNKFITTYNHNLSNFILNNNFLSIINLLFNLKKM